MLLQQKHLFNLSDDVTYLNCATMSAQLRSVEAIGIENLQKKSNPHQIESRHFFEDRKQLKERFAKLIDVEDHDTVCIIPSVSYGIATVIKNIHFNKADEVIILEEQFPSNFYAWKALEKEKGVTIKVIAAPPLQENRGDIWNEKILNAITPKTKAVAIPNVHWADGTKFNLESIRARSKEVNAYLIIDGTQSVGAIPISIKKLQPDALICAGYKWLMGAYGLGMAYYGERFYDGRPLENNWINHEGSDDFTKLVQYNEAFRPKATRFDMGESSNFIHVPMLAEGIRQLLEWTPSAIQEYCESISSEGIRQLRNHGYFVEEDSNRGHHLFGIYCDNVKPIEVIKRSLAEKNIAVSYRGKAVRVAPNVYNSATDIEKLLSCFI